MGLLIDIDLESFGDVSYNASQVMIYGFGHCKYLQLIYTLQNSSASNIKKIFECSIGNSYNLPGYSLPDIYRRTSEKTLIHQFEAEPLDEIIDDKTYNEKFCTRVCKNGAVSLIFDNFLREKAGLQIIPFIFIVDITGNKFPYNPANFSSRSPEMNSLVTHSELRRCYKLINEFPDPRIRKIAAETFRFVKINIEQSSHSFEIKEPFWLESSWKESWEERKKADNSVKFFKKNPWREQLTNAIKQVDEAELEIKSNQRPSGV